MAFQGPGFTRLNGGKQLEDILGASAAHLFGFCGTPGISRAQPRQFEVLSTRHVLLAAPRLGQIERKRNIAHRFYSHGA
jgi:hypothetical protein